MVKRQYNRLLLKRVNSYLKPGADERSKLSKYEGRTLLIYGIFDKLSKTLLGEPALCITNVVTGYGDTVSDHAWVLISPVSGDCYVKMRETPVGTPVRVVCDVRRYEGRYGLITSCSLESPFDHVSDIQPISCPDDHLHMNYNSHHWDLGDLIAHSPSVF